MKTRKFLAVAAIVGCAFVASPVLAQTLKHPTSVCPVSLSSDSYYGYYYGDEEEEPSPSDAVVEPKTAEPKTAEPAPVSSGASEYAVGCGDPSCGTVACDGGCGSSCGGCSSCYLFGPAKPFALMPENRGNIKAGGWTSIGYHNKVTPLSTVRKKVASFNDVPDRLNLHQQWAYLEKTLDANASGWDWGGRVDVMYGTDAQKTQAFGTTGGWDNDWDNGVYGWAIPQAYVEVGNGDFSVKAGHFYTLVGYEVVAAPGNFFYSHALTMFNSEPFTHTGVLGTYSATQNLKVYGGWTLGWDTGFRQNGNGSSWLGGFAYSLGDDITLTYMSTGGDLGWRGSEAYSHSIVVDVNLTEKFNYVFQTDMVSVGDVTTSSGGGKPLDHEDDFSINQYLFYNLNDCWAVGTRIEWWKDEGHSNYEWTSGLNYRPMANLVLRPEIRHDWQPYAQFDQTTFGVDAILTY